MRYVAVTRGFAYPTGEALARVRAAGGFPNMTEDERADVMFKVVSVGQDCSDMPAESLAHYLQRGDVAEVLEFYPARMTEFGAAQTAVLHGSERVISAEQMKESEG